MEEESIKDGQFFSPSKGNMDFKEVIKEIYNYISAEPEFFYDIIVGCDSPSSDKPFFPIAIVVLRTGAGGRFFLKKMRYPENYLKRFINTTTNWKMRILQEVYLSCELALSLRETLEKEFGKATPTFNYQFAYIHADVGEQGKTKEMVKEVTGLIKANGFEPKIKPFSFAASVVADRFT
ncbi:MAG: ribonuclease H-like YkuK family protein [bacterium]|nr:ribonuclease H-like YkuK family protein [bacterium]